MQPLVPKAAGKKSSMPVLALAALALVVGAFAVLGMGQVGGLATTDHSSHKKHHKHEKFDQENHPAGWVDHRKEDGNALNDAAKVARSARVVAEHPANWVDHHHPAAAAVVNAVASAPAPVMAPAPAPVMAAPVFAAAPAPVGAPMAVSSVALTPGQAAGLPTLTFVGDSISAGCCCQEGGPPEIMHHYMGYGFPQRIMKTMATEYNVHIHAGSGRTAMAATSSCNPARHEHDASVHVATVSGAPQVWQDQNLNDILRQAPDVVVIMLGTNDAYTEWRNCSKKFTEDYTRLVTMFKSIPNPPRIQIMYPPINHECDFSKGMCSDLDHNCIIKCLLPQKIDRIAAELGLDKPISMFENIAQTADFMSHNGLDIHPTCVGHAKIVEVLTAKLFSPAQKAQDRAHALQKTASPVVSGKFSAGGMYVAASI